MRNKHEQHKEKFDGSHPDMLLGNNNNNNKVPSNTTGIMIKAATCFNPTGSSPGLHYEPTTKKLC
jgi:hypothetical protein